MDNAGLSQRFPGAVSHAIHSLSLQDLRHYFEPKATEENGIPTINLDLKADDMVLPNAPNTMYEEGFMSMGLRAVDQVLSHMDNSDWDLGRYTILEKLVHSLHMQEVWQMMKPHYDQLVANPFMDKQVCPCVKDIENNGVLKFLQYTGLKIRYPQAMYGKSLEMGRSNPDSMKASVIGDNGKNELNKFDWDWNVYSFSKTNDRQKREALDKFDWDDLIYNFHTKDDRQKREALDQFDWDDLIYNFHTKDNSKVTMAYFMVFKLRGKILNSENCISEPKS